jgi:circadian clock protein KaiB
MAKASLILYVAGRSAHSLRAIQNLHRICDKILAGACEIGVVDVLAQPERAEQDNIIAIPPLIRLEPPPVRRVIGDLSDVDRVIALLGLEPTSDF